MAFLNLNNSLITDSTGSLYSFQHTDKGIEVVTHNKINGKAEKEIVVEDGVLDYDVSINEEDFIYLVCQKKDRSISIYSFNNYEWIESELIKETKDNIYNLKVLTTKDIIHIFYCEHSVDDKRMLNICHHYYEGSKWNTNIVDSIYRNQIVNPFEIIVNRKQIILAFYDLGDYVEEIFLKTFDIDQKIWKESVNITRDSKSKLYLDILEVEDYLHITYSEYENENLVIKHRRLKTYPKEVEEISYNSLSNLANCTYPTLIYENSTLWNVWTEYENVVSSYSLDGGNTWSNPYLWSESKGIDFARYKFSTNEIRLQENYVMNHSFGKIYPDLTFLGFGELEKAVEVPKKKDGYTNEENCIEQHYENYYEDYYIEEKDVIKMNISEELENRIIELEKVIESIERRIRILENNTDIVETKYLEKKINEIETYLNRRRNPFSTRT